MNESYNDQQQSFIEDEIDLRELFQALKDGRWTIISITSFFIIIGVIISLMLPNIYHSKALLVPVNTSSGMLSSLQSYSGLASLAGVNLPSSAGGIQDNTSTGIKKLSTLSFFENNILPKIFLPDLMAVKSWDSETNTVIYDQNIYNITNNSWVRDFSPPQQQIPSAQESFKIFEEENLEISTDKKTGFVSITTKHQSPYISKQWNELLIREINTFYRQKDKEEAQNSIEYLNAQLAATSFSEVKEVMAKLLQQEIQKLTLVEASEFYVFDYIDPPAAMEERSEPNRVLICIISMLFGAILGVFLTLIKHFQNREIN